MEILVHSGLKSTHLGLVLSLGVLLTLSAGRTGQGDLLPKEHKHKPLMEVKHTHASASEPCRNIPSSFCLEKGERLCRQALLSELTYETASSISATASNDAR